MRVYLFGIGIFIIASRVIGIGVEDNIGKAPGVFFVTQNSPNPFCYKTQFTYGVPDTSEVEVTVYDISGKKVATIGKGKKKPACYSICWSGKNEYGERLKSGVYYMRFKVNNFAIVRKLILIKI